MAINRAVKFKKKKRSIKNEWKNADFNGEKARRRSESGSPGRHPICHMTSPYKEVGAVAFINLFLLSLQLPAREEGIQNELALIP